MAKAARAHNRLRLRGAVGFARDARMGSEFIPSLDEGDVALRALPNSRHQPDPGDRHAGATRADGEVFPEVDTVFAKLGTAEIATDPMPPNVADNFVMLKPREQWPDPKRPKSRARCGDAGGCAAGAGQQLRVPQPIQMRFNELISGVRSDVAVKVFGDDMDIMTETAGASPRYWKAFPGPPM